MNNKRLLIIFLITILIYFKFHLEKSTMNISNILFYFKEYNKLKIRKLYFLLNTINMLNI